MREYELHPEAYVDLYEIGQYIADDSPDAARRVVTEIFDAIAALVPFPQRGHHRTDLTSRLLCFIRVYDYLIAYAPDEKALGGGGVSRPPQPARHGRDSQGRGR